MLLDLPLAAQPSPGEARRLLEAELGKPAYHEVPVVDRIVGWILQRWEQLIGGPDPSAATALPPWVTALLALLVVGLLAVVLPRVQRERRVRAAREATLGELDRSAAQYRRRAADALAGDDLAAAVLDTFRAIARDMADRTLLADAPGLTAHEIGDALAPRFPERADDLRRAATVFDQVRYGGSRPDRHTALWLVELDRALAAARPLLPVAQAAR